MPTRIRRTFVAPLAFALGLGVAATALAAEPAKHIGIYVTPYYEAAETPDGAPRVAVGKTFDALLASASEADILKARDTILAKPGLITPMTMMVLAIRLYETNHRDDAVFWFYAAKDRFVTLADVIDTSGAGLDGLVDAVKSFVTLAGPFINGYAYCDLANQRKLRADAFAWVKAHPYAAIMLDQIPAREEDRAAALAAAVLDIQDDVDKERAYLDDPQNAADFKSRRAQNEMDAKYCWK